WPARTPAAPPSQSRVYPCRQSAPSVPSCNRGSGAGCWAAVERLRRPRYSQPVAPRRPPGLAGLFFWGPAVVSDRVAVFIDYQNVHLTARELFVGYGAPPEQS